jgi:predicted double-glycine peptidase
MHVMVAYGYDHGGVYLTDPGVAGWRYYAWDEFLAMWNAMDGMALGIGGQCVRKPYRDERTALPGVDFYSIVT